MKKIYFLILFIAQFHLSTAQVTTPKEHFGFAIGDDYHLANFTQTEAYFKKLAEQSGRIRYQVIGKTEEGRDQPMLIISAPENLAKLEHFKSIAQKLARAELPETEAKQLAKKGKSVVWIDGGLHSTETVAMHQLIQIAYLLASQQNDETKNILQNSIILLTHANPDGQELVSNWYMREETPEKRSLANLPKLYQKYAGHDNNRDFFMLNLKESQNIARQLFIEWNPQIMYNHHQTAPAGAVVAGAPYRDPFNYVFDPLVITGIESLGAAMASRLYAENKPGYTQRGGSVFSTWYNGGLRTTTYFHNTIGLLTEIIGGPNPFEIPLVPSRLIPNSNTHNPVIPQTWHFKQSIEYSTSLNYAVLNYAAKFKEELLFNIYRMGRNSIEKGNQDTWSLSPSKVAVVEKAIENLKVQNENLNNQRGNPRQALDSLLKNSNYRDPRGYIISVQQENPETTIKFLNALSANGIRIEQAREPFVYEGMQYPANSYLIRTNQAFRPHILDMFEAQDHPNDFEYAGGPPIPPYDAAGWTLAYLMHINFYRAFEEVKGNFETLPFGEKLIVAAKETSRGKFLVINNSDNEIFRITNELLKRNVKVYRDERGNFIFPNNSIAKELLGKTNLVSTSLTQLPKSIKAIKSLRIGLWDTYGGSMPSGWTRFIFEKYDFDFKLIYAPDLDKGDLNNEFDVIILPSNALLRDATSLVPENIPQPFASQWGFMTPEKTIPQLEKFIKNGGHLISIGNSSRIVEDFKIGVVNHLVDNENKPLKREVYYTPGSVLKASLDNTSKSGLGYPSEIDFYFANNNVYKIVDSSIKPLMWFSSEKVLKSGWSWGEKYLKDGVIGFEKTMEKGKLTVFTPDITFRAQAHGTFKLLFNNLY
ncbi:M14 family metallopeptidase [Sphingobacterium composti Ten et al. 2007 non Yoo et al. 2007]|uniref:M14 family metallopeptidase n=1 Tax=Sphingobacterium composti TaxID=363260 RepID=UPI00135A0C02|nr:M14 family zinc carboxypeptidase [Sphingobacterium composti Ten et al. 2007 non Yoo et al. 2007]